MKYKLVLVSLVLLAAFGCKKPVEAEPGNQDPSSQTQDPSKEEPGPAIVPLKAPVLSIDVTNVVLEAGSEEQALKLTWTSAGDDAVYKIEAGTATPSVFAASGLERILTHKELASLGDGAPFTVPFKVKASAEGQSDVWSNSVTVTVIVLPERLYIYFWDWVDATNAQEMQQIEKGVFSWTGDCSPWEFKFTTSNTDSQDYWTGYFRDDTATDYWTLAPASSGTEATFKLDDVGESAGNYTITANLNTMKVSYVKNSAAYPEHLYIYFWAWEDPAKAKEMENKGNGIYVWTGYCNPWEFKFMTTLGEYWTGYFRDESASDYWTIREGGTECMFKLSDTGLPAGNYTITVDLSKMKVTVEESGSSLPENLYIYFWEWDNGGGATNAIKMTALGDGKFTWSGICPRWNMKFTTSNATPDDYWTGYFRDPDASDYWTLKAGTAQQMFDLDVLGRDGFWTINVDLNKMKVEPIPHLWLIGSAFSWGWDRNLAEEMTYLGNRQFTWTGTITNGTDGIFKFLVRKDGDWYGYWRNSTTENYWIAGENWNDDAQFSVTEAGIATGTTVTITFNTATGVVAITPAG